nr:MAG TPA: hypothetical protein [Caudoviricetes sp.]
MDWHRVLRFAIVRSGGGTIVCGPSMAHPNGK